MRIPSLLLALLATGLVAAPQALAQEEEPAVPNLVVFRYFECDLGGLGEAAQLLNGGWRSIMQDLQEEGMIMGYGILVHAWGDEWNLVDWIATEDMHGFHTAWSEAVSRANAAAGGQEERDRFVEICERHKDNMYGIVHPPSQEEPGS